MGLMLEFLQLAANIFERAWFSLDPIFPTSDLVLFFKVKTKFVIFSKAALEAKKLQFLLEELEQMT